MQICHRYGPTKSCNGAMWRERNGINTSVNLLQLIADNNVKTFFVLIISSILISEYNMTDRVIGSLLTVVWQISIQEYIFWNFTI